MLFYFLGALERHSGSLSLCGGLQTVNWQSSWTWLKQTPATVGRQSSTFWNRELINSIEIPNPFLHHNQHNEVSLIFPALLSEKLRTVNLNQLINCRLCCEWQVHCDSVLCVLVLMFHVQSSIWAPICNKPFYLFISKSALCQGVGHFEAKS